MVVDYSAITKQCALERTATKWPPSECCLIMLQPWCNLIAMPVSQQLMLNVICAHKKYIQSHTLENTKSISDIDATSFCVLPKFPETNICQQLYRSPRPLRPRLVDIIVCPGWRSHC